MNKNKFKININPFNHITAIGKIDKHPKFITKKNGDLTVFKVNIKAPRNYFNHDKSGNAKRLYDELRASCYITREQATAYKRLFVPGKWVEIRGEMRSVDYYNHNGKHIQAHPLNLEDIEFYKVPHTDKYIMTPFDKKQIINGIKGLNWLLSHPGLVRRFAKPAYTWLMAHDAFVPTRVNHIKEADKNKRLVKE